MSVAAGEVNVDAEVSVDSGDYLQKYLHTLTAANVYCPATVF